MLFENGDKFEGEWKNDIREGKGKMNYRNGKIDKGEWKKDKFQNKGYFKFFK